MTIKELKDFLYENYYRRIGFFKENSYYSIKHWKKLLLLVMKLIEKYLLLLILHNTLNLI